MSQTITTVDSLSNFSMCDDNSSESDCISMCLSTSVYSQCSTNSNSATSKIYELEDHLEKEPINQQLVFNEPEKINVSKTCEKIKMENDSDKIDNETIVPNEITDEKQDICVELNETEGNEYAKVNSNEVVLIHGLNNLARPLRIDDNIILELTSKKDIRQKVWQFLEENSLVVFPKPCFNHIPKFKGCIKATHSLKKLQEFKRAKTVQVTPEKAQETARLITLNRHKKLLVPVLRLKEGILRIISLPYSKLSIKATRLTCTQKGLRNWGNKLITLDQNNEGNHIDMIILGSVAVDRKGRRIGTGNGFCDLEFVLLNYMKMVSDNTVIVTIVHDAQVFNTLPSDIFKPYDVPVDIIITPTEIIRIETRLDRPKDVLWNYISKRRFLEIPSLQLLRSIQEMNSNLDCTLKEVDSESEELPSPKSYKMCNRYRQAQSDTNCSVFKDIDVTKRCSRQSLSNSNATIRNNNYHQDLGSKIYTERNASRKYIPTPKNDYFQNHYNNYSQNQPFYGDRYNSNSQVHFRNSRPIENTIYQNRYSNGLSSHQSRYNGSMIYHNNFNGHTYRHNNFNYPNSRYNNFDHPNSRYNNFDHPISRHNNYNGPSSYHNNYNGPTSHRYTNSRVYRPPRFVNNTRNDCVQESISHFNNSHFVKYQNSERPKYLTSYNGFVLKVNNIAKNVTVRDLKAVLMERGIKPLFITWKGFWGYAYLHFRNSVDINKKNVMNSLRNLRIKPDGIESFPTQILIVSEFLSTNFGDPAEMQSINSSPTGQRLKIKKKEM